jgi:hypothetical protein
MRLSSFGSRGRMRRKRARVLKDTPFPGRPACARGLPTGSRPPEGSLRDARPGSRDTRPVYVTGSGQRARRQIALRTRRKSTCLRTTSRGSAALIPLASHVAVRPVQAGSGIRTAARGALRCDLTCASTPPGRALIPPGGVSLGGSSPAVALPPPAAAGAGSHTRCRRGSPRVGAHGMGRRSCLNTPASRGPPRALVRTGRAG